MEKRKNNILLVIIAVLAVLLIASVSYVIYDIYIIDNNTNQNIENNQNEQVQREEIAEATLSDLNRIIDNELYVLWDKENINEITNQEKLQVALLKLTELNGLDHYSNNDTFTASELEEAFNKTSINYLSFNHETIHPFIKLSVFNDDGFIYDEETKTYTNAIFGSGTSVIEPYEALLKDAYYEDGKYYVSYQFIWIITPDVGPAYYDLYYSYSDAYNHQNSYFSGDDTTGEIEEYINNNEESIKENTDTYNYVFESDNDNYVLVDFSKGE